MKILVPIGGSCNDKFAVQSVIKRFMNNTAMEVHLVNVQTPFSAHVARLTSTAAATTITASRLNGRSLRQGRCWTSSPYRTRCTWKWATGPG